MIVLGVHDKHRERIRQRFLDSGSSFEDYQLLELLLYHSIPRGDTNPVAHELISTFGGIREVMDATYDQLKKVNGVGDRSAMLIKLVQRITTAYVEPSKKRPFIVADSASAGAYLVPKYFGVHEEVAYLMCLDAKGKLISCDEVSRGSITASDLDFRKIVEITLGRNAVSVILSHNHPSGVALPSRSDEVTTANLKKALAMVSITLADHIIIADHDWISMADSGLM